MLGPVPCAATHAALVKVRAASVRSSSAQNASKRPCKFHAISSATVAKHEALFGPPVRWRSAHRRCSGSQLSRHGRPESPSVSASRLLSASRRSQSVSRLGRVVAELAWPRPAEQTHAMKCSSSLAAVELQLLASVAFGVAASNPCLPAPNHSIERTCHKPLRTLWPAAHVER